MEDNEPLHFPQEMLDMFAEISRQQEAQVRQCKTMLAGFKATGETNLDYMDSYMKCLNLLPLCHQSSGMPYFRAKRGGSKVAAGGSKIPKTVS